MALIASLAGLRSAAAQTAPAIDYDGDGDDYLIEITSLAQLDAMRHDPLGRGEPSASGRAAHNAAFPNAAERMGCRSARCRGYELEADLVSDRANWVPVGSHETPFSATFEGNGRSISGLRISGGLRRMGMFGRLAAATVRDLNLLDVDMASVPAAGADANSAAAGGLASLASGNISNVYVAGTVSGTARYMGGLAGILHSSAVASSCADVAVSSTRDSAKAGGLAGILNAGNNYVNLRSAYARGGVSASGADSIAGGLVGADSGYEYTRLEIAAAYSAGRVSVQSGRTGGLVGAVHSAERASVRDSCWNSAASGIADDSDDAAPEGRTTSQLQAPTAASVVYANRSARAWDFGNAANDNAIPAFGGDGEMPLPRWACGGANRNQARIAVSDPSPLMGLQGYVHRNQALIARQRVPSPLMGEG